MHDTSPVYVTRTWEVALYGSYGEGRSARVYLGTRTVSLSGGRDAYGKLLPITAQVNGCEVSEEEAVSLLNWAKAEGRVTLLSEQRTVPTIGKRRACELHRLMSRASIPSGEPRSGRKRLSSAHGGTAGTNRSSWQTDRNSGG